MKRALSIVALTAALFTGLIVSAQAAPAPHHAKHAVMHKTQAHTKTHTSHQAAAHRHADAHKYQVPRRPRRAFAHWTPDLKAKKYHSLGTARYYEGHYYVSAYTHNGLPVKLMVNAITGAIRHANVHSVGAHR